MDTVDKFKELLGLVELNKNNPTRLSELVIELASLLYTHNELVGRLQLEETQAFIDALHEEGEKKMTIAEAEAQAVVRTDNQYKIARGQGEAIIECINAIKKRVDLLGWEIKSGQ